MNQNVLTFLVAEHLKRSIQERLLKSKNQQVHYSEILVITDNLKTTIGQGGFGKVYLGVLSDKIHVAVKLLSASSRQGAKEFKAEVSVLSMSFGNDFVFSFLFLKFPFVYSLFFNYGFCQVHLNS